MVLIFDSLTESPGEMVRKPSSPHLTLWAPAPLSLRSLPRAPLLALPSPTLSFQEHFLQSPGDVAPHPHSSDLPPSLCSSGLGLLP